MIRERALKILLVLTGLACLAGLYPLSGALRDGTATTINRQDQMILSIYIALGVFLLIAAREPREHRSLILFAGWSTLAHDGVMIVQGIQYHDLRGDLIGFAIIGVIGLTLIGLTPAKRPRASVPSA
ncbi:MAG: DUF6632 domain-containing protein [Candidatus Korobacteraceae bacterium]